eukprot:CAMPEP_0173427412 /NCGR_PEP_ID=MMETSP1357-20121228/6621_1 /TAXON_ID=77926 /ORGANISM="Hemiselmis rufescens, Strain PCC563" /LENGTH=34 /DNA_ID= /DNA_START= /DNA_END= /DNA_ORIENTATION=
MTRVPLELSDTNAVIMALVFIWTAPGPSSGSSGG